MAVVTARAGSKRVPGKNLRPLAGRPLILWSIEAARGIAQIGEILVSTDDTQIAAAARAAGALVPWLRPAELATDTASSVDVCLHALEWYEGAHGPVDGLLLLQPTSPFRTRETLSRGIVLFYGAERRPVVAVSPAASHPLWCFRLSGQTLRPYIEGADLSMRSQDLPPAYVLNGALYLIEPARLRQQRTFCAADMVPLVMDDPVEAIDIDSEWDWTVAQAAAASRAGVRK
ncbi:MAG: acylneuraminate cytidylyltransferase family protein [Gammaproteobacteria bacterium]|nr:acylneuraminate cytidylyltransferase family protein [Gammaproteobacteria bacterium]